jgi:hypothetical protein
MGLWPHSPSDQSCAVPGEPSQGDFAGDWPWKKNANYQGASVAAACPRGRIQWQRAARSDEILDGRGVEIQSPEESKWRRCGLATADRVQISEPLVRSLRLGKLRSEGCMGWTCLSVSVSWSYSLRTQMHGRVTLTNIPGTSSFPPAGHKSERSGTLCRRWRRLTFALLGSHRPGRAYGQTHRSTHFDDALATHPPRHSQRS